MRWVASFLLLLVSRASNVSGTPHLTTEAAGRLARKCGSEADQSKLAEYENQFQHDRIDFTESRVHLTPAIIDVYFHVILPSDDTSGGQIPNQQIYDQIDTLNYDYSDTGLSFRLKKVDRTVNSDWFKNGGPGTKQQTQMKQKLRVGGPGDLNVYTVSFSGPWEGLLGYSTFPVTYESAPTDDGVVIMYNTLPGGANAPYNLGRTLTHELGHWVGLYHTFQGGCSEPGDYVSDTPQEASPASGCSMGRDTCLMSLGMDPVSNFMDYSDDSCMNSFTKGQAKRMISQLMTYRNMTF
ncbi:hypothetical protein D9619_008029 [Psilocybe cf. subviscida]|uniref:Peptidase M43 pregnancy-associated plasma-A domain-containing protein n=1 Tax=Psilocybe cf. subviscida TaxID=2480587 RepID=A0A8H5AU78_9AGAR|nr:hypothetical protein D9619_008029 [Psilocybe cf. subviscida]